MTFILGLEKWLKTEKKRKNTLITTKELNTNYIPPEGKKLI